MRIALDAMGGDHGHDEVIQAALHVLSLDPDVHICLVGPMPLLQATLSSLPRKEHAMQRLSVHHAQQVVGMHESPGAAFRTKKDASMRVALELVRDGHADACVSAGNTGALVTMARFVLKTLPGVDRPAIVAAVPTEVGQAWVLDLGANVECTAEHLCQFARMGSLLVQSIEPCASPGVGLLNIGAEAHKGSDSIKTAAVALAEDPHVRYVGYVEGDDIFSGSADVIVCDGFAGNVALKTSEGVAKMFAKRLRQGFGRSLWSRFAGLVSWSVLRAFTRHFDPVRYNGATLIGLRGIVVKSHGSARARAFAHAIEQAIREVRRGIPGLLSKRMQSLHTSELSADVSEPSLS